MGGFEIKVKKAAYDVKHFFKKGVNVVEKYTHKSWRKIKNIRRK